jgi:hypothetical protein
VSLKLKRQREWLAIRSRQPKGAFPLGNLVWYGPTDRVASKAAAAVFIDDGEEPAALERWWQPAFDIRDDADVTSAIVGFFQSHQVKRVASVDRILGCPHEEGIDYPEGSTCPTCTFWAGRDRLTGALPVASPDERTETGGPGRSHDSAASPSSTYDVSTSLPSTLPASAALASPGPIEAATSATLTGLSKERPEPSGRRISIMFCKLRRKKSAGEPHFFPQGRTRPGRSAAGERSSEDQHLRFPRLAFRW